QPDSARLAIEATCDHSTVQPIGRATIKSAATVYRHSRARRAAVSREGTRRGADRIILCGDCRDIYTFSPVCMVLGRYWHLEDQSLLLRSKPAHSSAIFWGEPHV